jgi:hypothetical protein
METDFMEVGICCETTETMGCLGLAGSHVKICTKDNAWSSGISRWRRISKKSSSGRRPMGDASFGNTFAAIMVDRDVDKNND